MLYDRDLYLLGENDWKLYTTTTTTTTILFNIIIC